MATLCTHCGTTLKDTARYCNSCGTLVPSHPFSSKFVSQAPPDDNTRVVKPEQIARHSPPHPVRHAAPSEQPSWMSQLDDRFHNQHETPSNGVEGDRPENPFPAGVEKADWPEQFPEKDSDPSSTLQLDFPVSQPVHQTGPAIRDLHVKVWGQGEPVRAAPSPEKWAPAQSEEQNTIEDAPTRPLIASPGNKFADTRTQRNEAAGKMQAARFDAVEQLNTIPLATPPEVNPLSQPLKEASQYQQWEQSRQQPRSIERPTRDRPAYQSVPAASEIPEIPAYIPSNARFTMQQERSAVSSAFTPGTVPVQDTRQTPPPQISVSAKPGRKSRKALVLVSLLLLVLLGGVGAWVVIREPFSVPGITQPQQNFKDTRLGFSLLYPNGWRFQVDQGKATAHFYDSSHTAQVNVVVTFANVGDLDQYLRQQAGQLGLTGQKSGPMLSFAGASWHQIQGSVLVRGASYTETVIVTVHNQHLFTIQLLAPQITYAQEDQLVFSSIRSSFQFVA